MQSLYDARHDIVTRRELAETVETITRFAAIQRALADSGDYPDACAGHMRKIADACPAARNAVEGLLK